MKKIISSLAIALTLTIGFTGISNAQDSTASQEEVSTAAQEGSEREAENRSLLVQEKYRVVVTESDN